MHCVMCEQIFQNVLYGRHCVQCVTSRLDSVLKKLKLSRTHTQIPKEYIEQQDRSVSVFEYVRSKLTFERAKDNYYAKSRGNNVSDRSIRHKRLKVG